MKTVARYAICLLVGLLTGAGAAVQGMRAGFSDGTLSSGPWQTGKDFGSADDVVSVAQKYFNLPVNPRLRVIEADARIEVPRLFREGSPRRPLALTESKTSTTGVLMLTYRPAE